MMELAAPLRRHFNQAGRFVFVFGAAKAFAFFGPLVLARFMSASDYGAVEFTLSVGGIVAAIATLGITGSIPILYLIRNEEEIEDLLLFYVASIACVAFGAGAGAYLFHYSATDVLLCSIPGLFGLQFAASIYCRVKNYRILSGWADNLTLSLVTLLGVAEYAIARQIRLDGIAMLVLLGSAILTIGAGGFFIGFKRVDFLAAYRRGIGIGFSIMVNGLLMSFLVGSLRIFTGAWLNLAEVGAYSLCARVNLYMLLFHQVVMTGLYRKIYTSTARQYDRLCASFVIFLSIVGTFGALAFDSIIGRVSLQRGYDLALLRTLFPVVAMQTVLWVITALLEMPINREGVSSRSVTRIGFVLAAMVAGISLLHVTGELTLLRMCLLFNGSLVIVVLTQLGLLWRHGIKLHYTFFAMPCVLIPLPFSFIT